MVVTFNGLILCLYTPCGGAVASCVRKDAVHPFYAQARAGLLLHPWQQIVTDRQADAKDSAGVQLFQMRTSTVSLA